MADAREKLELFQDSSGKVKHNWTIWGKQVEVSQFATSALMDTTTISYGHSTDASRKRRREDEEDGHANSPLAGPTPDWSSTQYRVGCLAHDKEFIAVARMVARQLGAEIVPADDQARLKELQGSVANAKAAARDCPDYAQRLALERTAHALEEQYEAAAAELDAAFVRSIRDHMIRITAARDSADAGTTTSSYGLPPGGGCTLVCSYPLASRLHCSCGCAWCHDLSELRQQRRGRLPPRSGTHAADHIVLNHIVYVAFADPRSGDVTCTQCGRVLLEHALHDGDWARR
jgi:hypothetical protein